MALNRPAITSVRGGFPASFHDITIFRGGKKGEEATWDQDALYFKMQELGQGKKGIGDSGYAGEPSKLVITRNEHSAEFKRFLARAKSRQETLFSRLSSFNILKHSFRHGKAGTQAKIELHTTIVEATTVLAQYSFETGHPPMSM